MLFKQRTLAQIADMICGNYDQETTVFKYRSSSRLTEFFQDCDTDYVHNGTTRSSWVAEQLRDMLSQPQSAANVPPEAFGRVIRVLGSVPR
jgi:hypothetical protein